LIIDDNNLERDARLRDQRRQAIPETHLLIARRNDYRNLGPRSNGSIHKDFRYYSGVRRIAPVLVIGLLAPLIGCYSGSRPPRIGQNAPDFTVQDSDHTITLSQFRGQVVVLNFWGSWCAPCIEETPSMVQMQSKLKGKGVTIVAVSIDADDAAYHKFLKDFNVNFVTVRDEAQKTPTTYGTFRWPETYVIDRTGVVRRKFIGPVNWNSTEITDYLSKL
jgi:cytochrome c biogenesis protein CcmG/thiol:disulfide interchange protein DsbE